MRIASFNVEILDAEPDALIAVCSDMNAEPDEMLLRILRTEEEDIAIGALAGRVPAPIERAVPDSRRPTVLNAGRPPMFDLAQLKRFDLDFGDSGFFMLSKWRISGVCFRGLGEFGV